jgi:small subunit ribosomal protein S17
MNKRRRLTGFVVSNKMQKTVVVDVTRSYRHRLYKKVLTDHTRFKAHDELNCQVGDQVRIVESRPISRHKRWVVEEILRSSQQAMETEQVESEK